MKPGILLNLILSIAAAFSPGIGQAALLYSADFTTSGEGFIHSKKSPPAKGPQSVKGGAGGKTEGRWTASYQKTPKKDTDKTPSTFITSNGVMAIVDWGGTARLDSFVIDVSGTNTIDISATNAVTGAGANGKGEYFRFFYQFDNGPAVSQNFSKGGSYAVNSLMVGAASSLTVGFEFNVDGKGKKGALDGWQVSSLSVNASPVPEPSTIVVLSLGLLGLGFYQIRRRRPRSNTTPS